MTSPCRECDKKDLPKNQCMDDCNAIKMFQEYLHGQPSSCWNMSGMENAHSVSPDILSRL